MPQGKWNEILSLPGTGPPAGARGLCPTGGYEYSTAVYHYARTLALAAKAEGARVAGDMESAISWYSQGAVTAFMHLRVSSAAHWQHEIALCWLAAGECATQDMNRQLIWQACHFCPPAGEKSKLQQWRQNPVFFGSTEGRQMCSRGPPNLMPLSCELTTAMCLRWIN